MWWDMLRPFGDNPDPTIVASMILALEEVLRLPARHCQMSALHGLGHVSHESKPPIIRGFLSVNQHIDFEVREYAERALAGTVL
jgi:hypothetical protein